MRNNIYLLTAILIPTVMSEEGISSKGVEALTIYQLLVFLS